MILVRCCDKRFGGCVVLVDYGVFGKGRDLDLGLVEIDVDEEMFIWG